MSTFCFPFQLFIQKYNLWYAFQSLGSDHEWQVDLKAI